MFISKESLSKSRANLVFENQAGDTLSVSFDDNLGLFKDQLRRVSILVWDKEDKNKLEAEYVNALQFLGVLADFFGKKVVDKDETSMKEALQNMVGAFDNPINRRNQSDFQKEACMIAQKVLEP